jgi:CHAT domain-containing protein
MRLAFGRIAVALLISISSSALADESLEWLTAVSSSVMNSLAKGKSQSARVEAEAAVSQATQRYGSISRENALALQVLAKAIAGLEPEQALTLQLRSLETLKEVLGPEHPWIALALGNMAETYRRLARHDNALRLQIQSLEIAERALGAEHPYTATALNNLALTYTTLAQHEKALTLQYRSLEIRERVLGADHPDTAGALNNLAETYSALAHYDKALPLNLRSLQILQNALGPEHPNTALALSNLAETYRALAQYDKALPLQLRSLEIQEKVLGPEHPDTALVLSNLASTYSALAQYDKALPLELRSLEIREKVLGPEHPDTALALSNLASTYSALDQYDKALPRQLRSLEIREKVLGPEHPDTASALNNLAVTYSFLDEHDKALWLQIRSLQIRENVLGPEHPDTAFALSNLAVLMFRTNQPELATVLLKSSVNAYQSTRERVSLIGAWELRSFTESISHVYQRLASALADQGRLAEAQTVLEMLKEDEQFDFIRRSGNADPRRTRIDYKPSEESWMLRYREIADRLAALGQEEQALQKQAKFGLSEEQKKRQLALSADLKVARAAFESFLEQMRKEFVAMGPARSVEFTESSAKGLAELQALLKELGDDVVLLQIYLTDEQVNFLLTTPGVQLARSVKIKTQDLNRQVAALNRLLRDPKSEPLPAAQALYKLLLAPVEQDLQQAGAKTVMLSLDGVLRYLPFGVLHDGQRHALQRWNLPVYTSVVRERLRDAANANWRAAGLGVTQQHGEFAPLPAVRAEMSSIIRTGLRGVLPGEVHLDHDFTAQRLKDVTQRRFQVVHVASHFRFSPGTEVNSFLLLGDGNQLTLGDIRTQNYRFDGVDLLTLSACETGLGGGRDARGNEIEGFGVIAQQQGAKAVLATLWNVADQSTATLMGDMYRRRAQVGLSKIEALRQAQVALASNPRTSHPFYWAPFVLMGNWK